MNHSERQFVIGMAGHIDHGKTALVKSLTGIDTDRLKEEKNRGITIDLGFAHLTGNITIIDVPGHEKLIKNMVAGVSTIDLVLFVIAADDGIMPQTREHLDIVNLLGIRNAVFVITKIDLVEEEWLDLVEEEIRKLLKQKGFSGAPVLRASGVTGQGVEEVREVILNKLQETSVRRDDGIFRMPVDRAFLKAGFGSIVTGSVISGALNSGEMVEIMPEKINQRVRSLQSHDQEVSRVKAGYRAAINLAGLEIARLYRGQMVTLPGYYDPVELFNGKIYVVEDSPLPLKNRMRIRVHLHTTEVIGRLILLEERELKAGESGFAQILLENSVYASFGDRFIIRQFSPQHTLGGGEVLETNPVRYRKKFHDLITDSLKRLLSESEAEKILAVFPLIQPHSLSRPRLQVKTGLSSEFLETRLTDLQNRHEIFSYQVAQEKYYYSRQQMESVWQSIRKELLHYHEAHPGRKGMPVPEIVSALDKHYPQDLLNRAVSFGSQRGEFKITDDLLALPDFEARLSGRDESVLSEIENILLKEKFQPPLIPELAVILKLGEREIREYLDYLKQEGRIILVEDKMFFHADAVNEVVERIREFFQRHEEMRIAEFRDVIGTTRKYAVPLLIYMDDRNLTRREGDVRKPGSALEG